MCIQICFFSKAWYIVQTLWVSETNQKKSLQKHLKIGICWKNNTLSRSHVLQGEVVQVIFNLNTYTDRLVAEVLVFEHLCGTSFYPIKFKKTFLVRM